MKKQIDLARPKERRQFTQQPVPVAPVPVVKKEAEPVKETQTPAQPVQSPKPANSFSFITVLLIAIIVIMVGFIYYIFFLSA